MQLSVKGVDTFIASGGRPFEPSLPAVVMLHGAGFDHSTWALHSRWFAHHGYAVLAPDLPVRIEAAKLRSRSKNTPFDGWALRGGVAATIVGGRTVFVNDAFVAAGL